MSKNLGKPLVHMQRERQFPDKELQVLIDPPPVPITPCASVSPGALVSDPGGLSLEMDPHVQDRIHYYSDWLSKHAEYDRQRDRAREIDDYMRSATRVEMVGKVKVTTFAPFRARFSALQTFTRPQFLVLRLLCLVWLAGLYEFQLRMLSGVVAAITIMYTVILVLNLILVARLFHSSPEEQIDDEIVHALRDAEWPMYTILCPLYREASVMPQFVKAIQSLDYPTDKLQVLFLTEENDSETRKVIRALDLPAHFKIIVVPDG